MRILVAEDEPLVAQLIARVLEGAGDDVQVVASCAAAIDSLAAERFDLALLDLHLPDGDGFRVVESLEAGESSPPVVLITGEQFEEGDPRRERVAGTLMKPFDVQGLERAVDAYR